MRKWLLLAAVAVSAVYGWAYEVTVFGDTHYDSLAVRTGVENLKENRRKELNRNLERWQKNVPDMLRVAGTRSGTDVAFAVQLGDLIQGDCGSRELQMQSFRNALAVLQEHLHVPLYPVKGNHDVRGDGGKEAYGQVMLPYLDRVLSQREPTTGAADYAMMYEQDLYIFFDCLEPDLGFVEKALAEHPDARYVFFLTHFPVLPCSFGNSDQVVFGRPDQAGQRRKLVALLAGRHAIVLCGHIHRTTLTCYRSPEGTVTQLSSFSLVGKPAAGFKINRAGDGAKFFADPEIAKEIREKTAAGKLLAEFDGKIKFFADYAPGAGFQVLRVDKDGVRADLYFGASRTPATTLTLLP